MTPFTRPGVAALVTRVPREDYAMGQLLQRDDVGRVAAAVRITRDDGEDLAVLAPCATATAKDSI